MLWGEYQMEFLGYVAFIMVGLTLGLIGGGGSILAVPILVYLMGISAELATSYSLFLVGVTALLGAISYHKDGLINYRIGVVFAIPSFVGVFVVRRFLIPVIPSEISTYIASFSKDQLIMAIFSLVMIIASFSMIRKKKDQDDETRDETQNPNYLVVTAEGLLVGGLTGFVGAGGGFLIIPALVLLTKMPIKSAIATSLLIISSKSLLGFLGDVGNLPIDWELLGTLLILSAVGLVIGKQLNKRVDGNKLKKGFGYFVLVMGIYIVGKNFI